MTTLQTILLTILIVIWLCFSIVFLITAIQSAMYDRRREKREKEQATRDKEYHDLRMQAEIKRARWKNYRLRYFSEELEEVQDVCNH